LQAIIARRGGTVKERQGGFKKLEAAIFPRKNKYNREMRQNQLTFSAVLCYKPFRLFYRRSPMKAEQF